MMAHGLFTVWLEGCLLWQDMGLLSEANDHAKNESR